MCSLIVISTLVVASYCYCCNNNNCHCYHYYCYSLPALATAIAAIPLTSNLLALLLLPLTTTIAAHSLLARCHLPHTYLTTYWRPFAYCLPLFACDSFIGCSLAIALFCAYWFHSVLCHLLLATYCCCCCYCYCCHSLTSSSTQTQQACDAVGFRSPKSFHP